MPQVHQGSLHIALAALVFFGAPIVRVAVILPNLLKVASSLLVLLVCASLIIIIREIKTALYTKPFHKVEKIGLSRLTMCIELIFNLLFP